MSETAADWSPSDRRLGLAVAYACVAGVTVALGLSLPLLPLAMESAGHSSTFIGLNATTGALALLLTSPFVPLAAQVFGPIRLLVACFLVAALCMVAYPITPIWAWFPLRFLSNAALQGLFVVSEVWINTFATERTRGRLIAIYAAVATGGIAAGPLLAAQFEPGSAIPFYLGAGVILLGMLPVLAGGRLAPAMEHVPLRGVAGIWLIALVPVLAALVHGLAETAISSFLPVIATRQGWPPGEAILLITVFGIGNVALQIPIGWLADTMDRRTLLGLCSLISALGGLGLVAGADDPWALYAVCFLWGGAVSGIYTIGMTLIGQMFQGSRLASASAAFAFAYAGGSMLGPSGAGLAIDTVGQPGLGYFIALVSGAFALLIFLRLKG